MIKTPYSKRAIVIFWITYTLFFIAPFLIVMSTMSNAPIRVNITVDTAIIIIGVIYPRFYRWLITH